MSKNGLKVFLFNLLLHVTNILLKLSYLIRAFCSVPKGGKDN